MKKSLKLIPLYLLAIVFLATAAGCQKPLNDITKSPESTPAAVQTPTSPPTPSDSPGAAPQETPDNTATATPKPTPTPTVEPIHTITIFEHEVGVPYYADLDDDGDKEEILVYLEGMDYGVIWLSITDGSETYKVKVGYNHPKVYFCKNACGDIGVIISSYPVPYCYVTEVYTFDGTTPIETCYGCGKVTDINDDCIEIFTYVYAFGTWSTNAMYIVNENFMLKPLGSGLWNIELNVYDQPLTALKLVPVQMMQEGEYIEANLPVGTKIWPTATDGKSIFLFKTEDGQQGKIEFTFDGYSYIDGIVDTEWFDGIEYCG